MRSLYKSVTTMFGLNKLKEAQEKAGEIKERLDKTTVTGRSVNGEVEVDCTGNREIKDIRIDDSLFKTRNREEVQRWTLEASNDALKQAEKLAEAEMRAIIPGIPGLT